MRKFLMVVAVGALALLVASPAMAAVDFKFGAEYRVRMYTAVNNGFENVPGTNPRGVQLRVRPIFDVSDDNGNITARLRLEVGDVEFGNGGGASGQTNGPNAGSGGARVGNGSGGAIGADGINVETKNAYIDAMLPFGIPARLRAGIQGFYLPKGLIVDDDAAGLRAYGKTAPVSYEAFWYRLNGGPNGAAALGSGQAGQVVTTNTTDNNFDMYGVKVDVAVNKLFNPGVYYVYGRNASVALPADTNYIGLTVTGKVGIVDYDLDWVYGSMEGGPTGALTDAITGNRVKVKGWAVDGAVHFPVGPLKVNLAGALGTGDKQDGGDSEAFPTFAASWNGAGGGYELIGSGGVFDAVEFTQDMPTNLYMLGGWLEYVPVKPLWIKLAYGYAGFTRKNGNCATVVAGSGGCYGPSYARLAGKSALGHEFSLRADYTVWTGFKVQGQVGWLIPSGTGNKTAAEYVLQLLYSF